MLIAKCEICGAETNEQPIRMVDSRNDPRRNGNKPPPHRYAVADPWHPACQVSMGTLFVTGVRQAPALVRRERVGPQPPTNLSLMRSGFPWYALRLRSVAVAGLILANA
jgi:hypothetical protein